ncbi:MAG: FHA domain-containing protein [Burkholderiaceae bacterium]|nr:FHA domain-containing protein [Burkholderiaceae bacterium]
MKGISRSHAWLCCSGGGVIVVDLGSRNGTWLRKRASAAVEVTFHRCHGLARRDSPWGARAHTNPGGEIKVSGPKCCQVTVDWEVLEQQQRQSQEDDANELIELERRARDSAVDEARKQRIQQLKQRAEARRVQQEERRKREEQAAAARLVQARDEYQQAHAAWQEALAARLDIELGHPGMALPKVPDLPAADLSSEITVRTAIQQLRAVALAYQHAVDSAIAEYRNSAAATSRMKEWIGGFKARAVRSASEIITALEPDGLFVADRADRDRIERIAKAATEVVRPLQHDGFNVSDEFINQLDRVFSAETPSAAQTELERLRALAAREAVRLAEIKTAQVKQRQERETEAAGKDTCGSRSDYPHA